jgi:predicted Rossmann-fold nucleotide-binding protein
MAVQTHLPLSGHSGAEPMSRNHINVLSSNVLVALPGGSGTASEVALALRYGRPVIGFLRSRDEIPGLPAVVRAEDDLEKVKEFVRERIAGNAQASSVE